jgi:hypothetical protein
LLHDLLNGLLNSLTQKSVTLVYDFARFVRYPSGGKPLGVIIFLDVMQGAALFVLIRFLAVALQRS